MYCVVESKPENSENIPEVYHVPSSWVLDKKKLLYPTNNKKMPWRKFYNAVENSIAKCEPPDIVRKIICMEEIPCVVLKQNLDLLDAIKKVKKYERADVTEIEPDDTSIKSDIIGIYAFNTGNDKIDRIDSKYTNANENRSMQDHNYTANSDHQPIFIQSIETNNSNDVHLKATDDKIDIESSDSDSYINKKQKSTNGKSNKSLAKMLQINPNHTVTHHADDKEKEEDDLNIGDLLFIYTEENDDQSNNDQIHEREKSGAACSQSGENSKHQSDIQKDDESDISSSDDEINIDSSEEESSSQRNQNTTNNNIQIHDGEKSGEGCSQSGKNTADQSDIQGDKGPTMFDKFEQRLKSMENKMDLLVVIGNQILQKNQLAGSIDGNVDELLDDIKIPINSIDELKSLENSLSKKEFKIKFIKKLSSIGSNHCKMFTIRIIDAILSKQILNNMCWKGTKDKLALSTEYINLLDTMTYLIKGRYPGEDVGTMLENTIRHKFKNSYKPNPTGEKRKRESKSVSRCIVYQSLKNVTYGHTSAGEKSISGKKN